MMERFSDWLASTSASEAFASATWFIPIVQTVHILAIAVVVTTLVMFNFRLLKLTRVGPPLDELSRSFMPWTWRALWVLLATGLLMIITEPARELLSFPFWLKMGMVALLVMLTLIVHSAVRRDGGYWAATSQRRVTGSALAIISLLLCIGIVTAGRLIAYV